MSALGRRRIRGNLLGRERAPGSHEASLVHRGLPYRLLPPPLPPWAPFTSLPPPRDTPLQLVAGAGIRNSLVCVFQPTVHLRLKGLNLETGAYAEPPDEHWINVIRCVTWSRAEGPPWPAPCLPID